MPTSLQQPVTEWFAEHARDLPWREPGTTAWGVLVSEVMSQQTPVARVAPVWRQWLDRWPTPAALAAASPGDVLRAWQRLGYPRRALRLRECAAELAVRFAGQVPTSVEELRSLPGVGPYTAAAVASFSHGRRAVVLDTNVRRVLERVVGGQALPAPHLGRAEEERAAGLLPAQPAAATRWNMGVMELGALVCTARSPRCAQCPLAGHCRWRAAGYPSDPHAARRRTQPWTGTDRQVRGTIMARLGELAPGRDVDAATLLGPLAAAAADPQQPRRALDSLLADGLVAGTGDAEDPRYCLPA
ncbi:A/G-specific adenine glycosylase [Georgenia sp. MJ173]|uniref:A/G-specific adenine glycosylase n=1 Tax=Georgenia sunbinii TaxID=3117728 RepID=UPI002F26CE0B